MNQLNAKCLMFFSLQFHSLPISLTHPLSLLLLHPIFVLLCPADGNEVDATDGIATQPEVGYFDNLGAKTERCLERTFRRIGTFFATYPWLTLCCGLVFVVGMGYGITFLEVTTDPVKLWASAQSRSRIEREFFDSNFQPFFRIEQVIITARDHLPNIQHNTSNGVRTFGPVFDKDFLTEVYHIQEQIKALHTDDSDNVTLKDICYAPLTNGEPGSVTLDDCVIQSIWGYFQDELDRLDDSSEEGNFEVSL